MTQQQRYDDWFEQATGNRPYAYQRALAELEQPPSVLDVPTGSGKTQSILGAWMYQRAAERAPRRLVYALPMRTLVEQTADVAHAMRAGAGLTADQLPIHILMGGAEPPATDWRLEPHRNQILIGTIDMLLSRALNRGYVESRFAWPVAFGLLNSDCRWVFDEVQLMGPALGTSAQLDGLRAKLGTDIPCESLWVSATIDRNRLTTVDRPSVGTVLELDEADRQGQLAGRLKATKILRRAELDDRNPARQVAEVCLSRHHAGTRTLVVVNKVRDAQEIYEQVRRLSDGERPPSVLLHSRYRPDDRAAHIAAALEPPGEAGTIVVSTQVIEAGVDISAKTLITALAPFSSIVQRLGRCNRAGEYETADVIWLDTGEIAADKSGRTAAAPYVVADLQASRTALLGLDGQSLSPERLRALSVPETELDTAILRRSDLLDLFDTSPDLSGTDIDIGPFIRADDERTVSVFFRAVPSPQSWRLEEDEQPLPSPEELVQVPRGEAAKKRRAWISDHVEGGWILLVGDRPPPGVSVLLSAADGGYDPDLGWSPRATKGPVTAIAARSVEPPESFGSDSQGSGPEALYVHLDAVAREAERLAVAVNLQGRSEALRTAGALHDLGKAHHVFQELMRKFIAVADGEVWAKSGKRGGRYARPFFRHELASALALPAVAESFQLPEIELTRYLIGAHHGKVRLSIRPAPTEQRPAGLREGARFALGLQDGDVLSATKTPLGVTPEVEIDLTPMELGAEDSWTDAALRLRNDAHLGPFRLALLEALLRVADWRASGT